MGKIITQLLKSTFETDKDYDSIEDMCKHEKLQIPVLNVYGQRWHCVPFVKRVIINNPATIVLWEDGTKTVCKCAEGDTFDAEKGIAMCFLKKMFGNPSQVRKFMKKWIPWMVISRVKQKDVMDNRKAYNGNSTKMTENMGIVKCKECKHYSMMCGRPILGRCEITGAEFVHGNDFCFKGERR